MSIETIDLLVATIILFAYYAFLLLTFCLNACLLRFNVEIHCLFRIRFFFNFKADNGKTFL